ncbi:MAG: surface lipoprotein assembly modifier, partial [Ignavibacteria bacterium]|nr:surface lipoprotein assembly modifier [Ignavibacteria bacterium]
ENTGLSGYFTYRKNLNKGTRYSSINDYILYEEDVFNDLYSNDGYELGFSITQLLPLSMVGKLELKYESKNFDGMYVYDLNGEPFNSYRKDNNVGLGIELEKNLSSLINGLSMKVNYNYIINQSNDRFYKYNNNLFSITVNYGM